MAVLSAEKAAAIIDLTGPEIVQSNSICPQISKFAEEKDSIT